MSAGSGKPSTPDGSPTVILVRPQHPGNIGATARAMVNMGLERLLLIDPAPKLDATAHAFAVGADHILDAVERRRSLATALEPFSRAVGTTVMRNRQLGQNVVTARQLVAALSGEVDGGLALVFGPEPTGLTNDEIALLDPLVRIPCSARQPSLNLAQAVLLVAYELQLPAVDEAPIPASPEPAPLGANEQLLVHAEEVFERIGFDRDDTYHGVVMDLRRMMSRTRLTEREIQILHGICRRTLNSLDHTAE